MPVSKYLINPINIYNYYVFTKVKNKKLKNINILEDERLEERGSEKNTY